MSGMVHLLYKRKKLTPDQEGEICKQCQFCCRWLSYRVAFDRNQADYYRFVNEWGVPLALDSGAMVQFFIPYPCQHIRDKEGCTIYENRPKVCRIHKGGDTNPMIIPYCGWYEPLPDKERFEVLKSIEWGDDAPKGSGE